MKSAPLWTALALIAPWPLRAQSMSSANNQFYPESYSAGSSSSSSANFILNSSAGQAVAGSTGTSANFIAGPGLMQIIAYPGTVTNLAPASGVTRTSTTLQWTAPGYDGGLGALQTGSTYYIRVASFTSPNTFVFSSANISFSTSGTNPAVTVSTPVFNLLPNTTYFAVLWTADRTGNISFGSAMSTFTTLANAPTALALSFLDIYDTSVTVNWASLPASPPDASSKTCEGYKLDASSTNFGALSPGGQVYSSVTYIVQDSTLTLFNPPLDMSTTYYFRVGSLNWAGTPNYTALPTLNFQISQSTTGISLGGIDPTVFSSTVSISSVAVTNVGNYPATLYVSVATSTTPSSPWTLATSTGALDTVVLQGIWNSVQPASVKFSTPILGGYTPSGTLPLGNYAGDQSGFQVPAGQSVALWFKFLLPALTSTNTKQTFNVTVKAYYP